MKAGDKVQFLTNGGYWWNEAFHFADCFGIVQSDESIKIYSKKTKKPCNAITGSMGEDSWNFRSSQIELIHGFSVREWWKSFVKRHIVDDAPGGDESHSSTRYTLDEVNKRRGYE